MNVRRLRKLAKFIRERPSRYDQMRWCGTACCLAGHAAILAGADEKDVRRNRREYSDDELKNGKAVGEVAAEWLGLNWEERERLFAANDTSFEPLMGWPGQFWSRLINAKTPRTRAKIAAERIEHFIKTGGAE